MESCVADSKTQCRGNNGTAYIVIREEKNVNELGNNVHSLVPYDHSDEEDEKKKKKFVDTTQGSEDEDIEVYEFLSSDSDNAEFYHKPGTIEAYLIWAINHSNDNSHYFDILKDYGCSEESFCYSYPNIHGCFCVKLDKEQAEKMEGDSRIRRMGPEEDICCD